MARLHSPPGLSMRINRTDRRTGPAGFEAVWLRARIGFFPPLRHQVRQFSRHHAVGGLSGSATVSACDTAFITCRLMVRDNGMDGRREF